MSQNIYNPLATYGFSEEHVGILRIRLAMPQFVFVSGPAGAGKTKVALAVTMSFFQAYNRPFRVDGQDMTTAQILQAAKEHNAGIVFNDMASAHDYMRAGYCVDCRMIAIGIPFDGPAQSEAAYAQLLSQLPGLAIRQDVTVIGVDRDPDTENYRIDFYTP